MRSFAFPSRGQAHRGAPVSAPGGLPAWRTAMAANTWAVVPVATRLSDVDPEKSPTWNPNHPGPAPWRGASGPSAVLDAWCSLVPSSTDGRLYLPLGGGHADYAGNESYSIDLMQASPAWQMVHPPSGYKGQPPVNYNDGEEATGLYSDGRMRSGHMYGNQCFVPGRGIFVAAIPAVYSSAAASPSKAFWINYDNGSHSVASDYSGLSYVSGGPDGCCCYDSSRGVVWHVRVSTGGGNLIMKTDVSTGITTAHGGVLDTWAQVGTMMVYLPTVDLVAVIINWYGDLKMFLWNPATEAWNRYPNVAGSPSAGFDVAGYKGAAWVPSLGAIALWCNSANTTEITLITPPASNAFTSGTWTRSVLAVSGANAVTPPARPVSGGLNGRFGYLPALKGCYLQPTYASNLYFFATE